MLVMTAKVDKKKIAIILAAVVALIVGIIAIFGGSDSTPTASTNVSNNDARVAFLKSFGKSAENSRDSVMILMPFAEKLLQYSSTPKHCATAQHFF